MSDDAQGKRPPPDEKLIAWLTRLGDREDRPAYESVARALASCPGAIEAIYWTFVDASAPLGRAQMVSEICRRVEAAMKKRNAPRKEGPTNV